MAVWTAEIERILEEFNRKMSIIMAVEWAAFGLSMVAVGLLVAIEVKERRRQHGRHDR